MKELVFYGDYKIQTHKLFNELKRHSTPNWGENWTRVELPIEFSSNHDITETYMSWLRNNCKKKFKTHKITIPFRIEGKRSYDYGKNQTFLVVGFEDKSDALMFRLSINSDKS